ncbi:peptidoglycan editing factor PgeF [Spirochaetes bacterium]|uniref:Purine nucleoside phosphorylase n=1 Tax=Candidatus Scatousia excrementipullorum TaxID=2840936 RepID=A0A9D9DSB2_9BACT|nr:peptidoglycan editing factor PgeF [Candidatus Scatousia excrementipullorum]
MFYFDFIDGKKIMKSDLIKVNHFFTTRETIIKTKEPENLSKVKENKSLICKYLGISEENLISPKQTHTNNVEICNRNKTDYPDTDGLVLTNTRQAVFLNFADCTPLIFYDEKLNIGAVSHAGWRGTAGRIGVKTVERMLFAGSNIKNIKAVIGPAISLCCYNVGQEVLEKLTASVKDFSGLSQAKDGGIYVDLKGINARQLFETGIENIDICPYCTCCNNDLFFSYRKENATTNRHSAVLYLKN